MRVVALLKKVIDSFVMTETKTEDVVTAAESTYAFHTVKQRTSFFLVMDNLFLF